MPPMGHFNVPLDPRNRKHYLGFAAGSGITPLLSIIKTTLLTEPKSRFTLFYGNRSSSAVIFKEELSDLKDLFLERLNLVYVMSREPQDIAILNGRIDRAEGRRAAGALGRSRRHRHRVRLRTGRDDAGGVESAAGARLSEVADQDRAVRGQHPEARAQGAGAGGAGSVAVRGHRRSSTARRASTRWRKARRTSSTRRSRQGIELPYSCKGGVCSTCRAKLIEGEVDMDVNFALEDYEVARGFILCCQSYPVTDKVVVDFDHTA